MSSNLNYRNVEYRVKVGDKVKLSLTFNDADCNPINLSNSTTYATGKWKVWKPDGTLIINGTINFDNRATGEISYTTTSSDTISTNAGIWEGEVEIKDTSGQVSEQTKTFNFIIEESY